jgi:hypothetical protein
VTLFCKQEGVHCVVTILDELGSVLAKVEALEPRTDRLLPVRDLALSGCLNYDVVKCFVFNCLLISSHSEC